MPAAIASTSSTVAASGRSGDRPPSRARAELTRRWPTGDVGCVSSWRLDPSSTLRPPSSIAIRSHQRAAIARSWLIRRRALPSSSQRPLNSAMTCPATATSRLVVGSSAITSGGSSAMAVRWRGVGASRHPVHDRRASAVPRSDVSSSSSACCCRHWVELCGRWARSVSSR